MKVHSLLRAAPQSPPLANLGCMHCCGQPARTASKPSPRESWASTASKPSPQESWVRSLLRAAGPHRLKALPSRILGQHHLKALPSRIWVRSLLRAACTHRLKALPSRILGQHHLKALPSRIWVHSLLRAACTHGLKALPSRILGQHHLKALPSRIWVHSLLRPACPHRLKALPSRILGAFTAAGSRPAPPQSPPLANLGCMHCCGHARPQCPPLANLGPAPPQSPPVKNLGAFTAAGSLPAPPQSPPQILGAFTAAGSLPAPPQSESWVHSLLRAGAFTAAGSRPAPPQSPPLANLGCIHCCGQPARTASKPSPRESWVHSLLRAAGPHRLKALPSRILGAFTAAGSRPAPPQSPHLGCIHCCGQPARTASKPSPRESWVHSLLRAAGPHRLKALPSRILGAFTAAGSRPAPPQSPPLANLGCIHCCGQPARTASKPSPRESWVHSLLQAAGPHRLKALPSRILGAFTAAGSRPAPPQSPPLANLGCIHCCGQPARTASKPSPCESWVHSLLRAAGPHRLKALPSRILGAFTAAGSRPAPPQSPPLANLGCIHCCGQPARTASKPSPRESWVHSLLRAAGPHRLKALILGAFTAAGSRPAPPQSPPLANLGCIHCCGQPARTASKPSPRESWVHSLLRAAGPHRLKALPSRILGAFTAAGSRPAPPQSPPLANLGCIHCCGQPARTASKPSPRESWVHSLLRAAGPHRSQSPPLANLGCIHCCGQPARTASKPSPRESWVHSLLRAACPHRLKALPSRILGAFTAVGSRPAPPQSPPLANLGCIHCCGQPARTASKPSPRESWVHSLLRAAGPHRLKALPSRILGAFTAACSRPAPPQSPPLANLGCFHCCGQPARTASKPSSWVHSLLRAAGPHRLKALPSRILGAFTAAGSRPAPPQSPPLANLGCGQPARTASKPSPRESWVHSLLRAAGPHRLKALPSRILGAFTAAGSRPAPPQSPPLANLGCIHCCGQPARTALKALPSRILGAFTAAGSRPAPPQSPPLANLGCIHCCGQPARTASKPSPRESWPAPPQSPPLANLGCNHCCGQPARTASKPSPRESWVHSLLRAAGPHRLKALPSRILGAFTAAGSRPAPPQSPPLANLGCIHCCGQPARTASKPSPRESWVHSLLRAAGPHRLKALPSRILGAFTAAGSRPAPLSKPSPRESWVHSLLRAAGPHRLKALPSRILGAFTAAGSRPAPPQSPPLANLGPHRLKALPSRILGAITAAGSRPAPPQSPPLANLGCIHCCGQPARTASKPSPRESWVHSLLRAAGPHRLKALPSRILGAFTAAGSRPAPPQSPPLANLGCIHCCGQPARTASKSTPNGS